MYPNSNYRMLYPAEYAEASGENLPRQSKRIGLYTVILSISERNGLYRALYVTVTFNNDNAAVDDKADAMGNFEGFPGGTTQELTMLDTLDMKARANPGHAVTAISLEKKTGDKYSNVADNMKQENAFRFATPVNFLATEYRMCTHYDESSITVAPEPTINDKAALKDIGRLNSSETGFISEW